MMYIEKKMDYLVVKFHGIGIEEKMKTKKIIENVLSLMW